jgi:hypothetical protein
MGAGSTIANSDSWAKASLPLLDKREHLGYSSLDTVFWPHDNSWLMHRGAAELLNKAGNVLFGGRPSGKHVLSLSDKGEKKRRHEYINCS